jgi:hypothetical protein
MGRTGFAGLRLNITQLSAIRGISYSVPKLVMGLTAKNCFSGIRGIPIILKAPLLELFYFKVLTTNDYY